MDTLLSGATAASSCLGPNLGTFTTMMVKPVGKSFFVGMGATFSTFSPCPSLNLALIHDLIHFSLFLSLTSK
jgi:hypothetical protein